MTTVLRWCRLGRPRQGQALVLFALFTVVMVGALGLALDTGYDFAQRRTLQNAADAAALAGARAVSKSLTTVASDARTIATRSGWPVGSVADDFTCEYVDVNEASLGSCAGAIPGAASGVRVTLRERHQTFVMRALGITTSGTGATATARVFSYTGSGPYIVCAEKTALAYGPPSAAADPGILRYAGPTLSAPTGSPAVYTGADLPNYKNPDNWKVVDGTATPRNYVSELPPDFNPTTGANGPDTWDTNSSTWSSPRPTTNTGKALLIHAPSGVANCNRGSGGSSGGWKGVANESWNIPLGNLVGLDTPKPLPKYDTGADASSSTAVNGIGGCVADVRKNCVTLLPVALTYYPADDTSYKPIYIVKVLPFYLVKVGGGPSAVSSNTHYAYLLKSFYIEGGPSTPWSASMGDNGVFMVRLTK